MSTKAVLLLVSTLTVMSGATIAPSLPQMARVFAAVPNAVFLSKLLLTLPALAIAIFAPLAGYLVDRFGRLKVLYPALVLYAISGSIGFFIADLYIILASRAVLGIAVACIMTTAITLIGDYFSGQARTSFIGIQAAFMSLGGAVFVGTGGFLADLHWSYPFLIYLFSILVLVACFFALYEPQADSSEVGITPLPVAEGLRKIGLVLMVAFLSMVTFYMLPVQLPFLLQEIGIAKNSMAGIALMIATLASTVMGFMYGKVNQRFAIDTIFVFVFAMMGLGFIVVASSQSFGLITVGMLCCGFGMGMMMPNINTWLLQLAGVENRGRFSGLLSSSLFLGQFVSPLVVAPVNQWLGLGNAFLVAGILLGLGALFFLFRTIQTRS